MKKHAYIMEILTQNQRVLKSADAVILTDFQIILQKYSVNGKQSNCLLHDLQREGRNYDLLFVLPNWMQLSDGIADSQLKSFLERD